MSQRRRNNLTQQSLEESFTVLDPIEVADNVVRYIIYRAGEHINFSKAELIRNVIRKPCGRYEEIIKQVQKTLIKVYGYNMMVCDSMKGKDKNYVVSNILPHIDDPTQDEEDTPEDVNKILILLILSHILMSNGIVSSVSLYEFLKSLGIDVDLKHPIFGNVKEFINKVLVRKQYLISEIDALSRRQTFKWGLRAEKEISMKAILEFVCTIYKDKQPKDWANQYKIACEQAFENDPVCVRQATQAEED